MNEVASSFFNNQRSPIRRNTRGTPFAAPESPTLSHA
jgi:hypothetical protein